jgi:hypothetical protein
MTSAANISIGIDPNLWLLAKTPASSADNKKALSNTTFIDRAGLMNIVGQSKWEAIQATVASVFNGDDPKLAALLRKGPAKVKFTDGSYYLLVKQAGKVYCLVPSKLDGKPFVGAQVFDSSFEFPGAGKNPRVEA